MAYKYATHYLTPAGSFTSYSNSKTKNLQLIKSLLKRDECRVVAVYEDGKRVQLKKLFK